MEKNLKIVDTLKQKPKIGEFYKWYSDENKKFIVEIIGESNEDDNIVYYKNISPSREFSKRNRWNWIKHNEGYFVLSSLEVELI